MVVFGMMDFVQAGRFPKGLWRCKRQKVVLVFAWEATYSMELGEA